MIDIDAIKDDKPRKGPYRLGKSEKCEAQKRYKWEQRQRRFLVWQYTRARGPLSLNDDERRYIEGIVKGLKLPLEFVFPSMMQHDGQG